MKKLLSLAALCTAFVAAPAAAQMYVGAGVGTIKTNADKSTAWKLYGGYQFNPTWGAEFAYNDLGKYFGSNVVSWSLAGTATMPIGERWSVLGKLGVTSNRARFTGAGSRSDLLVGAGIGYKLTSNVGLRLEYEDFGKLSNVANVNNSRGRTLGMSVKYSF